MPRITTLHKCPWPDCRELVPVIHWGCKPHWFALPRRFRERIWKEYRRGQGVRRLPTLAYLAVAREVQAWIVEQIKCRRARSARENAENKTP